MSFDSRSLLITAIEACCAAIVFAALMYTVWVVGPSLETRYYPVAGKLTLKSVDWTDNGLSSVITIEFDKRRGCEYLDIAWYQSGGFRNPTWTRVFIRRMVDYTEISRPVGRQIVGPWLVYMSPSHVRDRSRVLAYHRCHPFWTTISVMYP